MIIAHFIRNDPYLTCTGEASESSSSLLQEKLMMFYDFWNLRGGDLPLDCTYFVGDVCRGFLVLDEIELMNSLLFSSRLLGLTRFNLLPRLSCTTGFAF